MPCYSYQEDPQESKEPAKAPEPPCQPEGEESRNPNPHGTDAAPAPLSVPPQTPPSTYDGYPVLGPDGTPLGPPPSMPPEREFKSIRRFVTASQITALVSLIIGGVPLSTVAVVLGLIGRSKANGWALNPNDPNRGIWMQLRRSATVAAIMGAVALALNAISLAMVYPVMMDMLQNGDLGSLTGAGTGSGSGGSSSVWG